MKDNAKPNSSFYSLDINKKARSASFWKGYSIVATIVAIASFLFMVKFASAYPKKAYVVEVDTSSGVASYKTDGITLLENYTPSETSTLASLSTFIKSLREITRDEIIQREYINKVYSMITGSAVNFVDNFYKENPPLQRMKAENVKIQVYNGHRVANSSQNSYQFFFNEKVYDNKDNSLKDENNYMISFHLDYYAPQTERDRETNPLGIWIKDISISRIKGGSIE